MISSYILTWKIFVASWRKDWANQSKEITKLRLLFQGTEIAPTAMWNVFFFNAMCICMLHWAGFSESFRQFHLLCVALPCITGSACFYHYKFGSSIWNLNLQNLSLWLQNWFNMQGIALACITQTAIVYVAGLAVEPLLPNSIQYSVVLPSEAYEQYLPVCVYCFWVLFLLLVFTLPLWRDGYNLSMRVAGRNATMTLMETFVELLYQTCHSACGLFFSTALVVVQVNAGFPIHLIHLILATAEILLFNQSVQLKFCILHQIMHEIKPLYNMVHIEHHICKGVHPTSMTTGLWESWMSGGTNLIMAHFLFYLPYLLVQSVFTGPNLIAHTMWPRKDLLQWHTLHHTILADIYSVNIPSPYDRECSETVKKYSKELEAVSPFIRNENLSDIAAFALMILIGLFFHYALGLGIGHVDWSVVEWVHSSNTV